MTGLVRNSLYNEAFLDFLYRLIRKTGKAHKFNIFRKLLFLHDYKMFQRIHNSFILLILGISL